MKIIEQKLKRDVILKWLKIGWTGHAVSPLEPKRNEGLYWGYQVRTVDYFSNFEKSSSVKGGY